MEENDTIDMIEELVISNMHPLLSGALSARASKKNEEAHRFIQDVLVDVNTRLWKLERKLDRDYMKTNDFINFLHKTLIKAALDLRKEKKRLFANIIVNSTLIGNADVNDGRKYLFDETIDKIDERLFDFLVRMNSRCLTSDDDDEQGWKGTDEELAILGVDDKTFDLYADYLLSVGVVVRIPRFKIENNGDLVYHEEYFLTQYGAEFVEYMRDPETMEIDEAEEC